MVLRVLKQMLVLCVCRYQESCYHEILSILNLARCLEMLTVALRVKDFKVKGESNLILFLCAQNPYPFDGEERQRKREKNWHKVHR